MAQRRNGKDFFVNEASPAYTTKPHDELDDSLAMTPWERMLANDDIINFGDSLRAAMEKRNAESR
jgi:hypothetical protein